MDAATRAFYAVDAPAHAADYEKADVQSLHDILRPLVKRNLPVLEIGGGSGRDAAFLTSLGCSVTFTDGCREMVEQAVRLHPEIAENARVVAFPLPEDDPLLDKRFDLILCVAVIMHLDDFCLNRLACQLASMMSAGGHVVLSHSFGGRNAAYGEGQRLFRDRSAADVGQVFAVAGFENQQQTANADGMGRPGICWTTHVFRKTA